MNRIGQVSDHITIRYLLARDTIEERVLEMIDAKRDVVGRVVDGANVKSVPTLLMDEFLKESENAQTPGKTRT